MLAPRETHRPMLSRRKNFNQNRSRGCRSREAHCPGKTWRHRQDPRCPVPQARLDRDGLAVIAGALPAKSKTARTGCCTGSERKRIRGNDLETPFEGSRVRPGVPWPRRTSIASRSKAMRTATTRTGPVIWPSQGMTDFSPAALSHRISGQRKETERSVTSIPCTVPGPDVPTQVPNSSASSPSPPVSEQP